MKKIVILIAYGLLSSAYADAPDETFKISVGGYLVANGETISNISTLNIGGTEINFHKDLDMDTVANSFKLNAEYHFNTSNRVEFSYYQLNSNGTNGFSQDIPFNGSIYPADLILDAYLNMDVFKLNYAYSFYQNDKLDIAASIGLHMLNIDIGSGGTLAISGINVGIPQTSIYTVLAPLPVLGLRMNYALTTEVNLYGSFDYFGLTMDKYSGSLSDFFVGIEYKMYDNIGIGAGWNIVNTDLLIKDDREYDINQNISAITLYLSYSF